MTTFKQEQERFKSLPDPYLDNVLAVAQRARWRPENELLPPGPERMWLAAEAYLQQTMIG